MVRLAPKSRRTAPASSRWASLMEQASASSAGVSKRSMAVASACGFALFGSSTLSTQSKAQPETTGAGAKAAIAALPTPKTHVVALVGGQKVVADIDEPAHATVGSILRAMNVTVGPLDRVTPDTSTPFSATQTISVARVESKLVHAYEAVPAQLLYRPTTAIRAGKTQQIQAPRAGKIETTTRVWLLNGHETRREFVSKRLSLAPQPRIIALGARSNLLPQNVRPHARYARARGYANSFRGGSPRDRAMGIENQSSDFANLRPLKCIDGVLTTGYSAGPAGGAVSNWTATGVRCTYGAVAVDPRLIPLGTKLYIEGYGYGFACDTGGAIKGKHIDLAFDSPRGAFAHGKRRSRVWILGR